MTPHVLLDTNVLVPLVIGEADQSWIAGHKNLSKYDIAAFELAKSIVGNIDRLVVTPQVPTEVSNISVQGVREPRRTTVRKMFGVLAQKATERNLDCGLAVDDAAFLRLGLTDAVLLALAMMDSELITDDLDLYLEAKRRGLPVSNFTHMRVERGIL